jgi:hypothetical protein
MEGYCSTGQNPQWAVVSVEEEEVHCKIKFDVFISIGQNSAINEIIFIYSSPSLRHVSAGNYHNSQFRDRPL